MLGPPVRALKPERIVSMQLIFARALVAAFAMEAASAAAQSSPAPRGAPTPPPHESVFRGKTWISANGTNDTLRTAEAGGWTLVPKANLQPDGHLRNFRWERCARPDGGCTLLNAIGGYLPTISDTGAFIRVITNAYLAKGNLLVGVAADTAVPVGIIKPSGKPDFAGDGPYIEGTNVGGGMLVLIGTEARLQVGPWINAQTFTYEWQRCSSQEKGCAKIPGQPYATYRPAKTDKDWWLRAVVTATSKTGSLSVTTKAVRIE